MDQNSIKTSIELLESGLTEQMGLEARWYAIPEAELNIKMMLEVSENRQLKTRMVDSEYTSRYAVDTSLTSDLDLKVKRVAVDEELRLTVHSEQDIVDMISKVRKVAELLHTYSNSFLNVTFDPYVGDEAYNGGNWVVEILHPPQDRTSSTYDRKEQSTGLIIKALLIVDDQSGEIIVTEYHK